MGIAGGTYVVVILCPNPGSPMMPCFRYGIIHTEDAANGTYVVQLSTQPAIFLTAVHPLLICQLPKSRIHPAQAAIANGAAGVATVIGSGGGVNTMSDLATVGWIVSGGAVAGLTVESMVELTVVSKEMEMVVTTVENDRTTGIIAADACVAAGLASATIGATMLSGMAVIAAVSTGVGFVGGLLAWGITSVVRQDTIENEYTDFIDTGRRLGYQGP